MPNVSEFKLNTQTGQVDVEYSNGINVSKDLSQAVTGVYNTSTGKSSLDPSSIATLQNSGLGTLTTRSLEYYGLTSDPLSFAPAMRNAVEDIALYASNRKGRSFVVEIPGGDYTHDGSSINVPSFAKFRVMGGVNINCNGLSQPLFWIRNDMWVFDQGRESSHNQGKVFDTDNGAIVAYSDYTAGGALLRIGNADGFYGTDLAAPGNQYMMLTEICGIMGYDFDNGLQYTNNKTFCVRHRNLRITRCNTGIITSTAVAQDAFELSTFHDCFFNNGQGDNIHMRSAHQFEFYGTSFTYSLGGHVRIAADGVRLLFNGGRFESGDWITYADAAYPRSKVVINQHWVTPIRHEGGQVLQHHLRSFFTGGQHEVSLNQVTFDLNDNVALSTTLSAPGNYYLSDSGVQVSYNDVQSLIRSASVIQNHPIPTRNSLVPNSDMNGNITGWGVGTAGTIAYSTAEKVSGAGSLLASITAGQHFTYSPFAKVRAGKRYYADYLVKLLTTPTPTPSNFILNCRVRWYKDADINSLSATAFSTTSGSAIIAVTWPFTHNFTNGEQVQIQGVAAAVNGIPASELNAVHTITVTGATTFTITVTTTASATSTGGNSGMKARGQAQYLSASSYAVGDYGAVAGNWVRSTRGSGLIEAPIGATLAKVEIATNASHTGNFHIDDVMLVELG